jgi:hypothetical protein
MGFALVTAVVIRASAYVSFDRLRTWRPAREALSAVTACRDLLIYCGSINCSHSVTMNADHLPDDTTISALGPKMICTKCGHVGADVRPDWSPHVNKRHV